MKLICYRAYSIVLILFFCLILAVSCEKYQQVSYSSDEERWLTELTSCELNGRKTGTQGCEMASKYIVNELSVMGYSPIIEEFSYRDSIMMRNIIVEIPGVNDSILIVGAHYDGAVASSIHQAANDNASGVVALLSLAKSIQGNRNTVLLCFWDGEENTEGDSFNGSTFFLEKFDNIDYIRWYCNIDCCGRESDSIYLYYSPSLELFFNDMIMPRRSKLDIIKILNNKNSSDYVPFKNKEIPFWGWNDYNVLRYIHRPEDSIGYISVRKIQRVSEFTREVLIK